MNALNKVEVVAGCKSSCTWPDVVRSGSRSEQRLAAKGEYGFLRAAWNVYLAAYTNSPKALVDFRGKAVGQVLRLQLGQCSSVRAYIFFKEESLKTPETTRVFEEIMEVADVIEDDFLKMFGKPTALRGHSGVPDNRIQATADGAPDS